MYRAQLTIISIGGFTTVVPMTNEDLAALERGIAGEAQALVRAIGESETVITYCLASGVTRRVIPGHIIAFDVSKIEHLES